jgi:hypothetical protein
MLAARTIFLFYLFLEAVELHICPLMVITASPLPSCPPAVSKTLDLQTGLEKCSPMQMHLSWR